MLAGRFRIIGLLGQGGMGEVYRATDLTLGQSVALKFLPESAARDARILERFHGEVRVARQVSHANVCRVYDIGEAEGMPFISMEYVDGEDLSGLLARIGRLPGDKALEIARKLCAGLAAAHDKGVIHRDLKPHNVMLNKRGDVVIMDFGLAAIADQLTGAEARHGTPAYMSPEQLKGSGVSARSDLYALGLVLYELFTGKRPFEAKTIQQLIEKQESAELSSMTAIASDIDPGVEKVIRRCLDPDPGKRPASALAVAAALPGGDPLAAALAAGETPSPDIVAASGETEGLRPRYAIAALTVVVLCLVAVPFLKTRSYALAAAPTELTPEVLAQKAREFAVTAGYQDRPADRGYWLSHHSTLLTHLQGLPEPRDWNKWLQAEAPLLLQYREASSPMTARPSGQLNAMYPPPVEPGMVHVTLNGQGRLRGFRGVPYEKSGQEAPPTREQVFAAAGLDPVLFSETATQTLPRSATEQLRGWRGPHPGLPATEIIVEIGTWRGQLSHVQFVWPWEKKTAAEGRARRESGLFQVQEALVIAAVFAVAGFALFLARRNWKLGRGDRRGAVRTAAAQFVLSLLVWACIMHPPADVSLLVLLFQAIADGLYAAGLLWVMYMALEPAVRARWPHALVTWNRVITGRWKDTRVWADVLIGAGVGLALWNIAALYGLMDNPGPTSTGALLSLIGTRQWIATHVAQLENALKVGLIGFFAIFCLRTVLRKQWLAALVGALIFSLFQAGGFGAKNFLSNMGAYMVVFVALIFVLLRFGLLATLSVVFFLNTTAMVVVGTDWSTWFAPQGLAGLGLLLGLAVYAFWRSLGSWEFLDKQEGA